MASDARKRLAAALEHVVKAREQLGDTQASRTSTLLDMVIVELAHEIALIDSPPRPVTGAGS